MLSVTAPLTSYSQNSDKLNSAIKFGPQADALYGMVAVEPDFPEWNVAKRAFRRDKPFGFTLDRVRYIHNPVLTQTFVQQLSMREVEAKQASVVETRLGFCGTTEKELTSICARGLPKDQRFTHSAKELVREHRVMILALIALNGATLPCFVVNLWEQKDHLQRNALHQMALKGNAQAVSALCQQTPSWMLEGDRKGLTALMLGAQAGHTEVCEALLKSKADAGAVTRDKWNALHYAVAEGHKAVATLLATTNPQLCDAVSPGGETPLHVSAFLGHSEICSLLVEARSDVEALQWDGRNVLHLAAESGRVQVAEQFASNPKLRNACDDNGKTPLHLAAFYGADAICSMLINAKADPEAVCHKKRNFLHDAAFAGSVKVLALFGSNPKIRDAVDEEGNQPAHLAAKYADNNSCQTLLAARANVEATGFKDRNVLHTAAANGNIEVAIALLAAYPKLVNTVDAEGDSALLLATAYLGEKTLPLITALLKAGARSDLIGSEQQNILHKALWTNKTDVAMRFANNRQLIEHRDAHGDTPLLLAAAFRNSRICEKLIKANANQKARNLIGRNLLHMTLGWKMKIFKNSERLLEEVDNDGYTPLMHAVSLGYTRPCRTLVEAGANPHAKNREGLTPLQLAEKHRFHEAANYLRSLNYTGLCRTLVEAGANPHAKNHEGLTPLQLAEKNGFHEAANYLRSLS